MLFVTLMKPRPGSTARERTQKRLDWTYPSGMRAIGEYWLASEDPAVVAIAEAESMQPIMQALSAWEDLFDCKVFPCVTADEGMALARQQLAAVGARA